MKNYTLIIRLKDNTTYTFNPKEISFDKANGKSDYIFDRLQLIDMFTSCFKSKEEMVDKFLSVKGNFIVEIMDSDGIKEKELIFDDKAWKEFSSLSKDSEERKNYSRKLITEFMTNIRNLMPEYFLLSANDTFNKTIEKLVTEYLNEKEEMENIDLNEDYKLSEQTVKINEKISEIVNSLNTYNGLRFLRTNNKKYDEYINSLIKKSEELELKDLQSMTKKLKNEKGSLYTLVAVDSDGIEYYFVPEFNEFIPYYGFAKEFKPKVKIDKLDKVTTKMDSINDIKGVPENLMNLYITYRNKKRSIKIPIIFGDEFWNLVANDPEKISIKGKTREFLNYFFNMFLKKDGDFYNLLTDDNQRGSYIDGDTINLIKAMNREYNDPNNKNKHSNTIYSFMNDYEKHFAKYNVFRSIYLNYKFYLEKKAKEEKNIEEEKTLKKRR